MEGKSKHEREITKTWNKLYTNKCTDERQTLVTHESPAREFRVCNTNLDEPLRFI